MKDKSAKDIAFEKERNKYRKEINELKERLIDSYKETSALQRKVSELEAELQSKNEWIERLLEYTEISQEDIKVAVEKDKAVAQALSIFNMFGGINYV